MAGRTLIIIPTKDRIEYICAFLQCLTYQEGEFDIFIADMCTHPEYLKNNWFFAKTLDHLSNQYQRSYMVVRVEGSNQLYGYQAGLEFARDRKYETGVGTDDDVILRPGWIWRGQKTLDSRPDASTVAGITTLPWWPDWAQAAERDGRPVFFEGKLESHQQDYRHATHIPHWTEPREYEQVYGPFMFRVKDFLDVGGFPLYLSRLGFRGELIAQTATFFNGRKLLVDPVMRAYHYSASAGGLKYIWANPGLRDECLKHDGEIWERFLSRREPTTTDPRRR